MANNKTLVYLLGAVVVLLAVIAGVLIFRQSSTPTIPATPITQQPQTTTPSAAGLPSSQGNFDPKTATKMQGKTASDHVKTYYDSILAGKWDVAFKLQPAASQANGDVQSFEQTQKGYGMKSYKILSSKTTGDQTVVDVEQDLGQNGKWGVQWTFVKADGNWVVQSRRVSMK